MQSTKIAFAGLILGILIIGGTGIAYLTITPDQNNSDNVKTTEQTTTATDTVTDTVTTDPVTSDPITTDPVTTDPVTTDPVTNVSGNVNLNEAEVRAMILNDAEVMTFIGNMNYRLIVKYSDTKFWIANVFVPYKASTLRVTVDDVNKEIVGKTTILYTDDEPIHSKFEIANIINSDPEVSEFAQGAGIDVIKSIYIQNHSKLWRVHIRFGNYYETVGRAIAYVDDISGDLISIEEVVEKDSILTTEEVIAIANSTQEIASWTQGQDLTIITNYNRKYSFWSVEFREVTVINNGTAYALIDDNTSQILDSGVIDPNYSDPNLSYAEFLDILRQYGFYNFTDYLGTISQDFTPIGKYFEIDIMFSGYGNGTWMAALYSSVFIDIEWKLVYDDTANKVIEYLVRDFTVAPTSTIQEIKDVFYNSQTYIDFVNSYNGTKGDWMNPVYQNGTWIINYRVGAGDGINFNYYTFEVDDITHTVTKI